MGLLENYPIPFIGGALPFRIEVNVYAFDKYLSADSFFDLPDFLGDTLYGVCFGTSTEWRLDKKSFSAIRFDAGLHDPDLEFENRISIHL